MKFVLSLPIPAFQPDCFVNPLFELWLQTVQELNRAIHHFFAGIPKSSRALGRGDDNPVSMIQRVGPIFFNNLAVKRHQSTQTPPQASGSGSKIAIKRFKFSHTTVGPSDPDTDALGFRPFPPALTSVDNGGPFRPKSPTPDAERQQVVAEAFPESDPSGGSSESMEQEVDLDFLTPSQPS